MSNPLTRFSDCVNANETIKTIATMTIKELCQWLVEMVKKVVAVVKRQTRNLLFLHLLREYQVLKYFCSYMVDDASVSELDHEIELLFIQHLERDSPSPLIAPDQQSWYHSLIILKINIPGTLTCSSLCIHSSLCIVWLYKLMQLHWNSLSI